MAFAADAVGEDRLAKNTEPKFTRNARVKVKGQKAVQIVAWPLVLPIPTIANGEFKLVETIAYRLADGSYVWEKEVAKA